MAHGDRLSGKPDDRVQHDKAGTRRLEIPIADEIGGKAQALTVADDADPAGETRALSRRDHRRIAHRKARLGLVHREIGDLWLMGAPIAVAHQKGNGAQHLVTTKAQGLQIAVPEHDAEIAGHQTPPSGSASRVP